MEFQKALGLAIRDVRVSRELSQEFFSDISSRTYMSVLEHGRKQPTVSKVNDLARAMGVHPLTILTLAYLKADEISTVNELQHIVEGERLTIGNRE
jgi:transcriptional regulator with XRE-family HTH domain